MYKTRIDEYLKACLTQNPSPSSALDEALIYGAITPGKRVRPWLTLLIGETLNVPQDKILPIAAAIEVVHCYSLVHDDLPSMDNSSLRHGRPSCHKAYGEGMAILVGDGLLPLAFEIVSNAPLEDSLKVRLTLELAKAIGKNGMVAGQVLDISKAAQTPEELTDLHHLKTGKLLALACGAPALLAGLGDDTFKAFQSFGYDLGLLYQVTDDLLDEKGNANDIGKPTGQDLHKQTILSFMSVSEAEQYAHTLSERAITHLPISQQHALRPIVEELRDRVR